MTMLASMSLGACATAPVAKQNTNFECDALPGSFTESTQKVAGRTFKITGVFQVKASYHSDNWAPATAVLLISSDQTEVGLRAAIYPSAPDQLSLALVGKGKDFVALSSVPWKKTSIPFSVALSNDGLLSVTAGGGSASWYIGKFQPSKSSLGCATSHAQFQDVVISSHR